MFIEYTAQGTNDGPYFGIPATGKPAQVRLGELVRFDADGLMTDFSLYYDSLTLLMQLGLVHAPEPSTVSSASWGQLKAKFR